MNGVNVGSVFFDLGLNNRAFRRGLQTEANHAESILGKAFGKIGKMAVAAFSVTAITKFASSAINLASDLEEVQNVVDVTFGEGNKKIEAFAQSATTSFGLSELSAKQYMGTMGAMLKSMGLTSGAVETMSMDMAGLAGDIASFYNLDTDEAFSKIRAGISGETEPLKQLGINMSVANMEAYALSQGITKSYNSMTQAEQALLRYNYLMSVTSDAQGDFTRTSGGWANQVRVLKLQWDSFKASLGAGFIAVLTPVIQGLNWLMSKLVVAANAFKSFINLITGGKAKVESSGAATAAAAGIGAVGDEAEAAGEQAKKGAKQAKGALASFDELNNLSKSGSSGSGGSSGGAAEMDFGSLDTTSENPALEETGNKLDELKNKAKAFLDVWGLTSPFNSFVSIFKTEVGNIKDKAVESWNLISDSAKGAFSRIVTAVKPLVTPLGTLGLQVGEIFTVHLSNGIQAGIGIWSTYITEAMNVIASGVEMGSAILQPILGSFVQFFNDNGSQIKTVIVETWNTIETIVSGAITIVSNTIQAVFGGITDFFKKNSTDIKNTLTSVWNGIWGFIQPIWNTILDACKYVFGAIKDFFDDNMGTIREIVSGTFELVWIVIKATLDAIKILWDAYGPAIIAAVKGVLDQIKYTFDFVWNNIKNTLQTVLNLIKGVINTTLAIIKGDWKGAWEGIKGIVVTIWDYIQNKFSSVTGFFKNTFTNVKNTLKNVWVEILQVFKAPINTIIGWINKLINAWNSIQFKVPEVDVPLIGKVGGFTVGVPKIPNIPLLAEGGVVDQPTLSVIGEAGREAVVPLENNTGWMVTLANILADALVAKLAMNQGNSNAQSTILKLMLDGRELGEVMLDYLIAAAERRGLNLVLGR